MEASHTLFGELQANHTDPTWVATHTTDLYALINTGLKGDTPEDAVRALLMIYPHAVQQQDLKRWAKLSNTALRRIQDAKPYIPDDGQCAEYLIANHFVVRRLDHMANVRQTGRRRRRVRINPRELFETYLIMQMTLFYRDALAMTEDRINAMLAFARTINHAHIYFKTYQALAYIYNHQNNPERALVYANLSYNYFDAQHDVLERALCAQALADAYAERNQNSEAVAWRDAAATLLSQTRYKDRLGIAGV